MARKIHCPCHLLIAVATGGTRPLPSRFWYLPRCLSVPPLFILYIKAKLLGYCIHGQGVFSFPFPSGWPRTKKGNLGRKWTPALSECTVCTEPSRRRWCRKCHGFRVRHLMTFLSKRARQHNIELLDWISAGSIPQKTGMGIAIPQKELIHLLHINSKWMEWQAFRNVNCRVGEDTFKKYRKIQILL